MTCRASQPLTPQTEEAITEARWIPTQNMKVPMADTYPSIKDILSVFFDAP